MMTDPWVIYVIVIAVCVWLLGYWIIEDRR